MNPPLCSSMPFFKNENLCGAYYSATTDNCEQCPKGSYCDGSEKIHPCDKGTFNDEEKQTSCKVCGKGTFNDLKGQSDIAACKLCKKGTFSNVERQEERC